MSIGIHNHSQLQTNLSQSRTPKQNQNGIPYSVSTSTCNIHSMLQAQKANSLRYSHNHQLSQFDALQSSSNRLPMENVITTYLSAPIPLYNINNLYRSDVDNADANSDTSDTLAHIAGFISCNTFNSNIEQDQFTILYSFDSHSIQRVTPLCNRLEASLEDSSRSNSSNSNSSYSHDDNNESKRQSNQYVRKSSSYLASLPREPSPTRYQSQPQSYLSQKQSLDRNDHIKDNHTNRRLIVPDESYMNQNMEDEIDDEDTPAEYKYNHQDDMEYNISSRYHHHNEPSPVKKRRRHNSNKSDIFSNTTVDLPLNVNLALTLPVGQSSMSSLSASNTSTNSSNSSTSSNYGNSSTSSTSSNSSMSSTSSSRYSKYTSTFTGNARDMKRISHDKVMISTSTGHLHTYHIESGCFDNDYIGSPITKYASYHCHLGMISDFALSNSSKIGYSGTESSSNSVQSQDTKVGVCSRSGGCSVLDINTSEPIWSTSLTNALCNDIVYVQAIQFDDENDHLIYGLIHDTTKLNGIQSSLMMYDTRTNYSNYSKNSHSHTSSHTSSQSRTGPLAIPECLRGFNYCIAFYDIYTLYIGYAGGIIAVYDTRTQNVKKLLYDSNVSIVGDIKFSIDKKQMLVSGLGGWSRYVTDPETGEFTIISSSSAGRNDGGYATSGSFADDMTVLITDSTGFLSIDNIAYRSYHEKDTRLFYQETIY